MTARKAKREGGRARWGLAWTLLRLMLVAGRGDSVTNKKAMAYRKRVKSKHRVTTLSLELLTQRTNLLINFLPRQSLPIPKQMYECLSLRTIPQPMGQFWGRHRVDGAGRRGAYRRIPEKCLDTISQYRAFDTPFHYFGLLPLQLLLH